MFKRKNWILEATWESESSAGKWSSSSFPTLSCLFTSPACAVPKATAAPLLPLCPLPAHAPRAKACPSLAWQGALLYQPPAMSEGQGRFTPSLSREASAAGKKTQGDLSLDNIFLKISSEGSAAAQDTEGTFPNAEPRPQK